MKPTKDNEPVSEQYLKAANEWVDAEAAASLLEETKSAVLAQKIAMLGNDLAHNKAENTIKASPDWLAHVKKIVDARTHANKCKVKLEYFRMRYGEWQSQAANERMMAKI